MLQSNGPSVIGTPNPRPTYRGAVGIMVAIVAMVIACCRTPRGAQFITDTSLHDTAFANAMMKVLEPELSSLGAMKWSIPEYHDAQPFVIWPAGQPLPAKTSNSGPGLTDGELARFGPMVSVYASPYLNEFRHRWQIVEQGTRGVLVAVIIVSAEDGTTLEGPYTDLGLAPGINCLWLALPSEDANWKGYVSAVRDSVCVRDKPAGEYHELDVQNSSTGAFEDYPPVVRIEETADGRPIFGVKCLNGWCDVGPPNPDAFAPTWTAEDSPVPGGTPQGSIKGWSDEQWLALPLGAQLRPRIRATIYPEPGIGAYSASAFSTEKKVATLVFHSAPPAGSKYANWGLTAGTYEVWVRNDAVNGWQVGFKLGAAPINWIEATRVMHHDAVPPATTRFRFSSPEELWFPCGDACCRSSDGTVVGPGSL